MGKIEISVIAFTVAHALFLIGVFMTFARLKKKMITPLSDDIDYLSYSCVKCNKKIFGLVFYKDNCNKKQEMDNTIKQAFAPLNLCLSCNKAPVLKLVKKG